MSGRSDGPHGKHCTWPECKGGCLVTVTVDLRALESFMERVTAVKKERDKASMFGMFTTQGEMTAYRDLLSAVQRGKTERKRLNG